MAEDIRSEEADFERVLAGSGRVGFSSPEAERYRLPAACLADEIEPWDLMVEEPGELGQVEERVRALASSFLSYQLETCFYTDEVAVARVDRALDELLYLLKLEQEGPVQLLHSGALLRHWAALDPRTRLALVDFYGFLYRRGFFARAGLAALSR